MITRLPASLLGGPCKDATIYKNETVHQVCLHYAVLRNQQITPLHCTMLLIQTFLNRVCDLGCVSADQTRKDRKCRSILRVSHSNNCLTW